MSHIYFHFFLILDPVIIWTTVYSKTNIVLFVTLLLGPLHPSCAACTLCIYNSITSDKGEANVKFFPGDIYLFRATLETPEDCIRYVQSYQLKHQTETVNVSPVSLLLTLNRCYTFLFFSIGFDIAGLGHCFSIMSPVVVAKNTLEHLRWSY